MSSKMRRVDVQVSILIIATTIFCSFCTFFVCYRLTYMDMIKTLEDRVTAIYEYLDDSMDKSTFYDINTKADMEKEAYISMQFMLNSVKQASNVRYLYTAKKTETDEFIYVIDGLDYSAEDFRYPGDLIEWEIYKDMEKALSGQIVMPDAIKNTDWGKIFITYVPVHDGSEVVGVLGIEFEAGHQYEIYRMMILALPIVVLFISALATMAAIGVFKRISNPGYKDMVNTDQLTQLKNRNAYETDIRNLNILQQSKGFGVISADLNNLKLVNDRLGHGKGDLYIQAAADAMRDIMNKKALLYRMGGDEYVILVREATKDGLEEYTKAIQKRFEQRCKTVTEEIPLSLSIGYALYDPEIDKDFISVSERADADMYKHKKEFHSRES